MCCGSLMRVSKSSTPDLHVEWVRERGDTRDWTFWRASRVGRIEVGVVRREVRIFRRV